MTATRAALEELLHEEEIGSTGRREFLPPGKVALLRAATKGKGASGTTSGKQSSTQSEETLFLSVRAVQNRVGCLRRE